MISNKDIFTFLLFSVSFIGHKNGVTGIPTFSEEELEFFATLGLCERFGGTCGLECPFRFITHKWGVPLCPQDSLFDLQCCIGPSPTETDDVDDLTTATAPATTAAIATTLLPPVFETCGTLERPHSRKKRIVGGQTASPENWPWLVAFRSMLGSHTCSGAVIAQRWVITAAHCFKYVSNPTLWRVRIGEYNLLLQDAGERDIHVQEIILHPAYRSRLQNNASSQTLHAQYVHDIALVRLSEDALTEPLCLPSAEDDSIIDVLEHISDTSTSEYSQTDTSNDIENDPLSQGNSRILDTVDDERGYNEVPSVFYGQQEQSSSSDSDETTSISGSAGLGVCWVAGWGATLDASLEDQVLREVSGDLIGSDECSQMWGEQLEDDMVCFGDGTYGPCAGDSGSPLSCERDGHFYLTGVVSWGTEDCNVSGYPSVFTNTRSYLSWILEQMNTHV